MFHKIKGQDKAISVLKRATEHDKVAGSYLFYGPEGVGKFTTALYFGMMINCHAIHESRPCGICSSCRKFLSFSHPDLLYIFPFPKEGQNDISLDGEIKSTKILQEYEDYIQNKIDSPWKEFSFSKNIGIRIASIRMLEHRINLSPNEGEKKIYIIENADLMNDRSANAFLKTLEEPPNDTVIILTTSKPNSLLPTIISRCQQIQFRPLPRKMIADELAKNMREVDAKMFSRIANGSMEKAIQLSQIETSETRIQVLAFLKIFTSQDDIQFLKFAENFSTSKNKNILNELISHLINWLADIAFFQTNPDEIINLDYPQITEYLYRQNPAVNEYVSETVDFLNDLKRKLNINNVNPHLIIIRIYNKLSEVFFN